MQDNLRHNKPRLTRAVTVGGLKIGGDNPLIIQSMCNTATSDLEATLAQIRQLVGAGCELVRLAIRNQNDIKAFGRIKERMAESPYRIAYPQFKAQANPTKTIPLPLVADIHYDIRLAQAAITAGADKIRLNPGNTIDFKKALDLALERLVPVRLGYNAGSSSGFDLQALVNLARDKAVILAAKSSSVIETIKNYRALGEMTDAPLHIGETEAGTPMNGAIKSAVGIGALLAAGIGDTIRVSVAGDPTAEVRIAYKIARALGLRYRGVEVIACPTCGRTQIDIEHLAAAVEKLTANIIEPLTIAVMGCGVNGPGEAQNADFGIAGGQGTGLLFAQGQIVERVAEDNLLMALSKLLAIPE